MNDWFEWNGVKCTDYGIYVTEQPPPTIPEERVTFTEVPGRSGSLTTLEGDYVYEDMVLTATCVISAMRSAARAAVSAAKSELKIQSPSRVFEDEVGVMTMRGWGVGVLKETRNQAKIIRNASRYLTGEAREGAIAYNTSDNRRTYNNSVNSTIQVAQMVIRDEQDIRSLAVEIATLTRRQQRGKGLRMA